MAAQEPIRVASSHQTALTSRGSRVGAATTLRWIMVAVFVGAASAKLLGLTSMIALFNAVGFGQWFRYVIGIGELTGALLLAAPRTALPGTFLLSVLMIGAAGTEMFILRRLPLSSGVTLLALVIVAMTSLRPPHRE
jgi:putative oxidoreductase